MKVFYEKGQLVKIESFTGFLSDFCLIEQELKHLKLYKTLPEL